MDVEVERIEREREKKFYKIDNMCLAFKQNWNVLLV